MERHGWIWWILALTGLYFAIGFLNAIIKVSTSNGALNYSWTDISPYVLSWPGNLINTN